MKRVKELRDPTGSAEWKRFNATLAIFEKYGQQRELQLRPWKRLQGAQGGREARARP